MSRKSLTLSAELHEYVVAHSTPLDPLARDLVEETWAALPRQAGMQIAPEQSVFLTILTRLLGVRRAVEVGTFTGLSSLAIARGLPEDGQLICFDISEQYTSVARRYWERAGVAERIELRLGAAAQRLRELPEEPTIDLAFIDADKPGYPAYWAEIVPRVRRGGAILVDNTLRGGRVLDPAGDETDSAIVRFNDLAREDDRVELVVLPLGDGVTLARKR
ncbi:O-methyltransferase [Rhizomonospora bruguierae]|uniref:O-methyltransferase n=1 Tax=Rhizomonospora bruguierae TaxID=1581705 RepID=UPI001BD06185|nr:O-methyltransferase [Micromonospora sp. NBRC 107566]